jgi:hypothetical protein
MLDLLSAPALDYVALDSQLLNMVLKTRVLMNHFTLAAIKLRYQINNYCFIANRTNIGEMLAEDFGNTTVSSGRNQLKQCPVWKLLIHSGYITRNDEMNPLVEYELIGRRAWCFTSMEFGLLFALVAVNAYLMRLLIGTRRSLSTATILFIVNNVLSNFLFAASFVLLLKNLFDNDLLELPVRDVEQRSAALVIAESLIGHIFQPSHSIEHLVQDLVFSVSQNGSLLGFVVLLTLVLYVMHQSKQAMRTSLSNTTVIGIFVLFWFFLLLTQSVFAILQYLTIGNMQGLFVRLSTIDVDCQSKIDDAPNFAAIANQCHRLEPYHQFGIYLLRGQSLFTVAFLFISLAIVTVILVYHRLTIGRCLDQPHTLNRTVNRRRVLFRTLHLSICVYFLSIAGQTLLEIVIFFVDDKVRAAEMIRLYQWARMAAFIDPLCNPVLAIWRTPALRLRCSAGLRNVLRWMRRRMRKLCRLVSIWVFKTRRKLIGARQISASNRTNSTTDSMVVQGDFYMHNFFETLFGSHHNSNNSSNSSMANGSKRSVI